MILKRLCFAAPLALLWALPAWAGEELLFGPAPDWVEALPAVENPTEESSLPVRLLRMDRQTRMDGDRQVTYSAIAFKIQAPEGLNAGNLSLPWRPETEELTIHRIALRRGAETIDVLASGQTFTTLRREQNLEQAMLDGVLTANLIPEDLQVGDILEVVTTLTTTDPVFAGHSEELIGPFNAPVDNLHVRLMWPSSTRMRLAKTDDLPAWQRSKADGYEVAELEMRDLEPLALPRSAPLRFNLVRFIQASDFASWADLSAMEAPLYEKASQVPAEGPLRNEIERIRQSSFSPVSQTEAALQLVQRRVRYVALAMGEGGYVPADATLTWSRRYGDCKGKTALLLAILGELGIEAEAVLVHSAIGDSLPNRLPAVGAFDHVLVRAVIDGRTFWLDGTRSGDTTLDKLTVPYFDWGLPLRPRGAEFIEMMPGPLAEPHSDVVIHMDASQGVRAPVPTRVELTLRGDSAIVTNQRWASFTGDARDRALREYWRDQFDFIEPDSVGMAFDEAAGELRMTLTGRATMEWNGSWYETDWTRLGYQADFTREPGPNSDAPFAVAHPIYTRTRQTIVLPPGFNADAVRGGATVDEVVAGVEYRRHTTFADNTFFVEATERSVAAEFPAAAAPVAEKRLRELWDEAVYLRMPNGYRPTEADLAVVRAADPTSFNELIAQGNLLLNSAKYDEALVHFTRATELQPASSIAWANRGVTLAWMNRFDEATTALDKAEASDPGNAIVFNGRGLVAARQRNWEAAIAAYTRAVELDPKNEFAIRQRASLRLTEQEPELALADAAEALKLNPRLVDMYGLRAFVLIRLARKEDAAAEIETMLAALPGNAAAIGIATQIYNDIGMKEKASELAQQAVANSPTALVYYNLSRGRDPDDTPARLADLDKALELDPRFVPALFDRAGLHFAARDLDKALADTEALLTLASKPPGFHLLRANIFSSMGRREDALAEAKAIVAESPDDTMSHVTAGKIYSRFGMEEEALAAIDRALEIRPEPYIYVNRSQVRDQDDHAARLADLDEALRLDPTEPSALALKSGLLTEMGDHAGAAEVLMSADAESLENPGMLNSRGIALVRAGRLDEAERDFTKARTLANDAMSLNGLCYAKALANVAIERALEECEASLRLRPDLAPTLDSRGTVLLRLGRHEEALSDFDRVLEKSPTLTHSRYLRAVARSQTGDSAGAEADLAIAREADPKLVAFLESQGFELAAEQASVGE